MIAVETEASSSGELYCSGTTARDGRRKKKEGRKRGRGPILEGRIDGRCK